MIVLIIIFAGCIMPGTLKAEGKLYICGLAGEEINNLADRAVILTFWRFPSFNNSPPQPDFDNVHLFGKDLKKTYIQDEVLQNCMDPSSGNSAHLSRAWSYCFCRRSLSDDRL